MQTAPENGKGRHPVKAPTPMQTAGDSASGVQRQQPVPLIDIEARHVGTENRAVMARKLHAALGIGRDFTNWFKAQVKRGGFVEGEDYREVYAQKGENPLGGRPSVDFALTIDTAKHIALMSGTPKGRQYRTYLIAAERELMRLAHLHDSPEWKQARREVAHEFRHVAEMLQDVRADAGKPTAAHHFINEARLIRFAMTGDMATPLDRERLTRDELRALGAVERLDMRLIARGMTYAERKAACRSKVLQARGQLLRGASA